MLGCYYCSMNGMWWGEICDSDVSLLCGKAKQGPRKNIRATLTIGMHEV